MNHRHPKLSSSLSALALLGLGVVLALTTGLEPAGAAVQLDAEKPYLVTKYQSCTSLVPTGLERYDFCDGHAQYVGSGQRSECYTEAWLADCL